ncbi:MAG TPA: DoxX family protein [Acidobacteriaceae bacterium]|nr:DoxX family protein [Acidobacteriaceae bacterium]
MPLSFPELSQYTDWGILAMRLMVGAVFFTSGFSHLKQPQERAKSIGMSVPFTIFLGLAEVLGSVAVMVGFLTQWAAMGLILFMFGAIYMKAFQWKTGFWGEKSSGWHYDLVFVVMNLVILLTDGGRFVVMR